MSAAVAEKKLMMRNILRMTEAIFWVKYYSIYLNHSNNYEKHTLILFSSLETTAWNRRGKPADLLVTDTFDESLKLSNTYEKNKKAHKHLIIKHGKWL